MWAPQHGRIGPLGDNDSDEVQLLREIRDLLRPIADHYSTSYKRREKIRALIAASPARRKAWDLLDGVLVQREIAKRTGMDEGNLSKYFKSLREISAITGEPPQRAEEV